MDVTLKLNGRDYSDRISSYRVVHEPVSQRIVTTMDYLEHTPLKKYRTVIRFTLDSMSEEDAEADYNALSDGVFTAIYTDPYAGERTQTVHLTTDLDLVFVVTSTSGVRYYNGGELELRASAIGLGNEYVAPEEV